MDSKIHAVIMKAAINLCGTKLLEELHKPINVERWENYLKTKLDFDLSEDSDYRNAHTNRFHFRNYADLLIYGSYMEDQTHFKSEVEAAGLKNGLLDFCMTYFTDQGKHLHWLEHYWGNDLERGKGLELTVKYVCEVVNEATGADALLGEYFGQIGTTLMTLIGEPLSQLINGTDLLDSFRAAPDRAEDYWDILIEEYKNGEIEAAYFNLGKVCHLLVDMCTPAHVHGDCHLAFPWLGSVIKDYLGINLDFLMADYVDDDQYEFYTGKMIEANIPEEKTLDGRVIWSDNLEDALPERWSLTNENGFPTYDTEWSMMNFFYYVAEITKQYDSDDVDGSGHGQPYRWDHFNPMSFSTWDLKRKWDGDLTNKACDAIAEHLIPLAIATSAGLLYKFCDTVGLPCSNDLLRMHFRVWDFTVVNDEDDYQEGEIYLTTQINNRTPLRSGKFAANSGDYFDHESDKRIMDMIESFVVHDLSTNRLEVNTDAYDNDDWDLGSWKWRTASDSLGYTNKVYKISELPTDFFEFNLESSNGDYLISYEIYKEAPELSEMVSYYKNSKFIEGRTFQSNPILLNMTTMQRHFSVSSKNLPCGTWNKITSDKSMSFFMTKEELFEESKVNLLENLRKLGEIQKRRNESEEQVITLPAQTHTNEPKTKKVATNNTQSKDLLTIAYEIEHSNRRYVRAALEKSPYKKFIRLICDDPKLYEKWSKINKDNLDSSFSVSCSCCRKSYIKRKAGCESFTPSLKVDPVIWYPPKTKKEKRAKIKSRFENLRDRMYYESKNEIDIFDTLKEVLYDTVGKKKN